MVILWVLAGLLILAYVFLGVLIFRAHVRLDEIMQEGWGRPERAKVVVPPDSEAVKIIAAMGEAVSKIVSGPQVRQELVIDDLDNTEERVEEYDPWMELAKDVPIVTGRDGDVG